MRHSLFIAMIAILANNKELRSLHRRNLTREKNQVNKMQSIIALSGKFIRIFFAVLRKGVDYDPEKMLEDMRYSLPEAA
ncbi:Uncharacterized [Syntrophomonas zehnderi OL-4]|uniref:Uncharacterized n=1 Tax=Syntrophomonas zehnderi OL-4 TaxID=690567 RepID=A0A0E3W2Q1_9FIRM|nr:Uncharacterized [Syntrophomonas zehnderi OL-4]